MKFETIVFEKAGAKAVLRINRPERGNAFENLTSKELLRAFEIAEKDEMVKVVVLTGTGNSFCAGGDVKEMHKHAGEGNLSSFLEELSLGINRVIFTMRNMKKPIIGRVNGHAVGAGLGLLLGCDILIAVKEAKFSAGFTGIGLAPGCSTYFLPRLMGYNRCAEFLFCRETLTAEEAKELGLLNYVVEKEKLDEVVESIVSRIVEGPSLAVGWCKELLQKSIDNTMLEQMRLEASAIKASGCTEDAKEGIASFVEKRKPVFKGK